MPNRDFLDVRVRQLPAEALDVLRPMARRYGYRHTHCDILRFAVAVATAVVGVAEDTPVNRLLGSVSKKRTETTAAVPHARFP